MSHKYSRRLDKKADRVERFEEIVLHFVYMVIGAMRIPDLQERMPVGDRASYLRCADAAPAPPL